VISCKALQKYFSLHSMSCNSLIKFFLRLTQRRSMAKVASWSLRSVFWFWLTQSWIIWLWCSCFLEGKSFTMTGIKWNDKLVDLFAWTNSECFNKRDFIWQFVVVLASSFISINLFSLQRSTPARLNRSRLDWTGKTLWERKNLAFS
jgi:hypothetical protein